MKIGIGGILIDHIGTLRDARSGQVSFIDICIFYALPIILAVLVFFDDFSFKNEIIGQSIAVFAIFSALLFSVQVALFGIYTKKRSDLDDYAKAFAIERLTARRDLIRETNANISYLIVVSAISVTILLVAFATDISNRFEPAVAVFLYGHFMLTLLMIIKRVHALFDREYRLEES